MSIDDLGRAAATDARRRAASYVDSTARLNQLRRMRLTRTAASAVAVVAVCAAIVVGALVRPERTSPAAAGTLIGDWFIAAINGSTVTDPAIQLRFANQQLQGSDGCDAISGSTHVRAGQLTIRDLALTGTTGSCTGAAAERATAIDRILNGVMSWSVSAGVLTLEKAGSGRLVYRSAPTETVGRANVPWTLAGRTWELTTLNTSFGVFTQPRLAHIRIRIDSGGRITVTHGCYVNVGTVRIRGAALDIHDVTLRRTLPCPPRDPQEQQRLDSNTDNALYGSTTWSIDGDRLRIRPVGSQVAELVFRRV